MSVYGDSRYLHYVIALTQDFPIRQKLRVWGNQVGGNDHVTYHIWKYQKGDFDGLCKQPQEMVWDRISKKRIF